MVKNAEAESPLEAIVGQLYDEVGIVAKQFEGKPVAEMAGEMEKLFTEFGVALVGVVEGGLEKAYTDGIIGRVERNEILGAPLAKGMGQVSAFASSLQQLEATLRNLETGSVYMYPGQSNDGPIDDDLSDALESWLLSGAGILRVMLDRQIGPEEAPEPVGEKTEKAVTVDDLKKVAEGFRNSMQKFLAKADAAAMDADGNPIAQEEQQMDPIEEIGRMAAGIINVVEEILGSGEEEAAAVDPATAPAAAAAPPPPAPKEGEGGGEAMSEEEKKRLAAAKTAPDGDLAKGEPEVAAAVAAEPGVVQPLVKDDAATELAKATGAAVVQMMAQVGELAKGLADVTALVKSLPAPGGPRFHIVGKEGDGGATPPAATDEDLNKMSPEAKAAALTKRAHTAGGRPFLGS